MTPRLRQTSRGASPAHCPRCQGLAAQESLRGYDGAASWDSASWNLLDASPLGWGKALGREVSLWGPSTPKLPEGAARGGCWAPGAAHPSARNQQLAPEEMLASQEPSPEKQLAPSDGGQRSCAHQGVGCGEAALIARPAGRRRAMRATCQGGSGLCRSMLREHAGTEKGGPLSPAILLLCSLLTKSSIMLADKKTKIFKGPSSILAKQVRKIHLEVRGNVLTTGTESPFYSKFF